MLSIRCYSVASILAALFLSLNVFAQGPGSTPAADYFVHHKHASVTQSANQNFGSAVAISGDVMLSADPDENIEILRRQGDGSWAYEASLAAPEADIAFGQRHALATNGDWIAVGAKLDDTFGLNSGAVHMYKFDGADWEYRGALSHMAPHGSIVTDQFGMALAMDGDRMVVGSRAENGVGAAGAVHYFTYNTWLDMWLETGFIASEHTEGNSTSKYGESVDISGDWMIVGEHRNNTNGQFAGAVHIYQFYNQCWHHAETFYGDAEWNWLGYDVAISGTNAVAGAPHADTDGLNEAGAAKLYQLLPFSGTESFWTETFDITAPIPVQGDWFGLSIDIDEDLLLVGAPRDDDDVINGGVGYFMFDCTTDNFDCVAEGLACDAMQNDRLGMDVALSSGLAVIGAPLDDNIFTDAGSAYVLGASDMGFACDLTAPAAPMVDLVDENDSGADNEDNLTRHTTPDFDVFLPGGGTMALMSGVTAEAGDALVWSLDGTSESEMVFLTEEDIDNGYVTMEFIYPGPVLPDGVYTYCAYIIDVFGNVGATDCLTITIDNEDPEPSFAGGAEYDTSNTDDYGAFLPGAMTPEECEGLAATAGGTWDGIFTDAATHMVSPGCYNVGANTYEWQTYATFLPDTTLYLDAMGNVMLDLSSADNISATDNIAIDMVYADLTDFDCDDAGMTLPVTITAVDMAGNEGEIDIQVQVLDTIAPVASVQDLTVYLDETGHTNVSAGEVDAGSFDVCTDVSFSWSQAPECAGDIPRYPLTSGTYDEETSECDDCTSEVELGFDFTFYGVEYNSLWISSNGLLSFLSSSSNCCDGELLTDGSYDASIAVIHTDIDPDECSDCGIYYATYGEAPNREFVVSWHYVSNYEDNAYRHDGQAVLYEGTNVIEIFNGGLPTYLPDDCDDPMTTGISNQDGTEGVGPYEQICGPVPPALFVFTPNGDGYEMISCTADLVFDCADVGENNVTLTVADEFGNTTSEQLTITVLDEVAPTVQAAGPHVVYLNEDGEVEYEDLLDLYVALDACGVDTSYVSHVLTCETAIGMEEQSYLMESGPHMMLFVDYDGHLYSFNALNNEVILLEYTGLDVLGSPDLLIPEGDSILYVGDGYEDFVSLDLETGLVSDEFEANENLGVLFDTDNGLGFEDLQAVETAGGVHYALSHDGDGYNVGSGNPLFTFEVGDGLAISSTLLRMLPMDSPEGDDWDWTALAIDAENEMAYAICDENGMDSGSNEKELWSIDWNAQSFVTGSECAECDPDSIVSFTKPDSATAVVDTITPYLALARGNRQGYFNAMTQSSWNGSGPEGTYWKMGPTSQEGEYTSWIEAHDWCPPCQLEDTMSLWVPQGNLFFDIVTTSWTCCQNGGGFAYTRTLVDAPDYSISILGMEGIEHMGRLSARADAMIFYDGALYVGYENGNIGRVSFTAEGLEEEVLVEGAAMDDIGGAVSGYAPQFSGSMQVTAIDVNGNESTTELSVLVVDTILPTILAQDTTLLLDGNGFASLTIEDLAGDSYDNCGIESLTADMLEFDCDTKGENSVTITAIDNLGNVDSLTVVVTVLDLVLPTAIAQDISVYLDEYGMASIESAEVDNGSDHPCGGIASMELSQTDFDCSHVGPNTVTLTVFDGSGNSAADDAIVTVIDSIAPSAEAQNLTVELDIDGAGSITAAQVDNGSSDACGIADLSLSQTDFDCSHVGANTVTLTVTDNNGNQSTATATVTVEDKIDPTASAQDLTVQLDSNGLGSITVAQVDNGSADACGIADLTLSQTDFDCNHLGANAVTLTVTDENGNQSTATATITVEDNIAPSVSASGVTVYLDETGSGTLSVASTTSGVTDNCSVASLTIAIDGGAPAESVSFDCSHVGGGGTEAEIVVTDGSGNETAATAIILTLDTVSPVAMAQNLTVQLDATGAVSITAAQVDNGSSDACGIALSLSQTDFDCSHVGANTVTLTVTDTNGNQSTTTATITVEDNVDPVASAQDLTVQLDASGNGSITAAQVDNGSADACGIADLALSQTAFDCSHVGTNTVTLTVTDNNGNQSTATATITVEDNVAPVALAQDLTVQLDAAGAGSISAAQVDNGSSDACGIANLSLNQTDFDCSHVGANTVTLTVTDNNGNQSTATATITVEDNVDPAISLEAADMTVECDGSGNQAQLQAWLTDNGGAEASDACGISWSHDFMALSDDCGNTGSALVTFTVQDPSGNSVTTSATFTIEDNTDPSIDVAAANQTVECDGAGNEAQLNAWIDSHGGAAASDICGGVTWSHDFTALSDDCGATGSATVTFTATDDCGNPSTTSAIFTIEDTTAPDITNDPEGEVYQRDGGEAQAFADWLADFGGMTSGDDCGGTAQSHDSAGLSDECGSTGSETVTFTATDDCGNETTREATFTVIDDHAPSCPLIDLTDGSDTGLSNSDNITNDDTPTVHVVFTGSGVESAEAGDIVELYIGGTLSQTHTVTQTDVDNGYAAFETGPLADGAVGFSALHIDDCGQSSIFAFLNIIVHSTNPSAAGADITVVLDEDGNVFIEDEDLDDGSEDDFNVIDLLAGQTDFDCSDVGDNTVTLTVTDIAGNTATTSVTVTVVDDIAPTVELVPTDGITVELGADGTVSVSVNDLVASASDNCGIASMALDITSFDCDDLGDNAVVVTVTDVNGNATTASATVTVEDNLGPVVEVVTGSGITVELGPDGTVSIEPGDVLVSATDNCGVDGMSLDISDFDCDDLGNNAVVLTVTDVNGNSTSETAYVTVEDNEAPVVNIFDLEAYTLSAGETCVNEVDLFAAGQPWYEATDNCGAEVEIVYDVINETGMAGCREFDRRWIIHAVDASGNTDSDTTLQHITVLDDTAPMVFFDNVPEDLTIELGADCTGDIPATASVTASATDNCTDEPTVSAVTMTDSAPEYLCEDAGSYTITRTFMATATDECGNETVGEYIQTLTFLDVTAPQITDSEGIENGETISEADADDIFAFISVPNPIDLDAADACGGDVTIVETESFSGFVPTDDIGNYCGASTPAAFLDGEACDGSAPAAIVLEGAYFGGEAFTIADGDVNIVESFYDQTLHIEVEVTNADGTGGFIWSADYNEAFNWAQWSGLGRGYKKDCANVLPGQSPWTGWDYFVMQTGGMIGTGIYAGSELSLTHQPMNYYYGLQVGQGANNQNAKYGASAWFYWSGELVVNGASQGSVASSGDIMLDLDCTMPWSAEYAYTVSDACGNTTTFSYTVEGDESNAGGAYVSGEESGHQPFDISVVGDLKDPIRVTGLMPNPTNDVSQLGFVVSHNMRLRVDLYNMAGELIQELYDGNAMTDVEYLMNVDANGLEAGMYQIRIASSTYMAVKKLLVTQ